MLQFLIKLFYIAFFAFCMLMMGLVYMMLITYRIGYKLLFGLYVNAFYRNIIEKEFTHEDRDKITEISEWLDRNKMKNKKDFLVFIKSNRLRKDVYDMSFSEYDHLKVHFRFKDIQHATKFKLAWSG